MPEDFAPQKEFVTGDHLLSNQVFSLFWNKCKNLQQNYKKRRKTPIFG
jgi:hypothetical protein